VSSLRITPLDIRQQEFKKCMRGLDPHEVQAFLEMVADELELLVKENANLTQRLREVEERVEDYRKLEKTLQDTLTSAHKVTEELRIGAEKEAKLRIREAELKADTIVKESKASLTNLHAQITSLRSQKRAVIARFRSLLLSQLRLLDQEEREGEQIELASPKRQEKDEQSLVSLVEEEMKDES